MFISWLMHYCQLNKEISKYYSFSNQDVTKKCKSVIDNFSEKHTHKNEYWLQWKETVSVSGKNCGRFSKMLGEAGKGLSSQILTLFNLVPFTALYK